MKQIIKKLGNYATHRHNVSPTTTMAVFTSYASLIFMNFSFAAGSLFLSGCLSTIKQRHHKYQSSLVQQFIRPKMEVNERTMWICHITKYIRKDFQVVIRCTALQMKMKHWHIKSPFVNFYLHAKFKIIQNASSGLSSCEWICSSEHYPDYPN